MTYVERRPVVPLLVILLVSMGLRIPQLPLVGHESDLKNHHTESLYIIQNGLFNMYDCPCDINHPPIGVALFAGGVWVLDALGGDVVTFNGNDMLMIAMKVAVLVFEIALLCLVYYIVWRRAGVFWASLTAALLAIIPAFVSIIALWGQTDSIFVFFLVLALFLFQQDRPGWAWAVYGLAWLSKYQSIMILPLLTALTWRRYGWRTLGRSLLAWGLVLGGGMLPFVLGSGNEALFPFTGGAVDRFPHITNGAYNLWFWISGAGPGTRDSDKALFLAGLDYHQTGLLLLTLATALICLRVVLLPERDDEFLVAAAAGVAFFNLPTQIHSRYLYSGLVFLAIFMARNWKLTGLFVILALAFSQNLFRSVWLGSALLYYPSKLFVWNATHSAIVITLGSALLFGYMLLPLWEERHQLTHRFVQAWSHIWHPVRVQRGQSV
jgi:Gpi18-like mannosyltransferase